MRDLTKAEEQVMQILWKVNESIVRDLVDQFPDPKPAYNTVSTVLRVLEKKDFVNHKAYGTTYVYFPIVSKKEYSKFQFTNLIKNYFNGSFPKMAAFFAKENNLTIQELEEMMDMAKDEMRDEDDPGKL
ncbi:MAG: BlaI/MecI/CopY family transcriptional regulator [Cyclobacteriaceae bacterium]|nr:BlaI/MecI/CopY family transcriptional regulator [Cyclobacteriaceae bacterium]MCK5279028.1 BlaI/MecI/CopY family transcriptional regulator [Cyclobacteriaceae bacterium]MCK5371551.1 BlaI/MecI/CopY family transcriptional regulator [Cyclobacteriaceae bacterium]